MQAAGRGHQGPEARQDPRVKTLLETLCTLAQDRLIGIFQNRTKEMRALDPNRTCPPFRPRAGMTGSKAPSTK